MNIIELQTFLQALCMHTCRHKNMPKIFKFATLDILRRRKPSCVTERCVCSIVLCFYRKTVFDYKKYRIWNGSVRERERGRRGEEEGGRERERRKGKKRKGKASALREWMWLRSSLSCSQTFKARCWPVITSRQRLVRVGYQK